VNAKNVSRKMVAKKLGLTEAAVCQYLKKKRGGNYKFNEKEIDKIRKMADMVMNSEKDGGICFICKEFDAPAEMMKRAESIRAR